jgi:hypothetical protein
MDLVFITSDPLTKRNGNQGKEALITAGKNQHRFGFTQKAIEITGFTDGSKISIAKDAKTGNLFLFSDEERGMLVKKWDKSSNNSKVGHQTISFTDSQVRKSLNIKDSERIIFKVLGETVINEKSYFGLKLIDKAKQIVLELS